MSTMTVWKFPVEDVEVQTVDMPLGSQVLTAQVQYEKICLWALVNPDESRKMKYSVWIHGTGDDVEEAGQQGSYLSTVQLSDGERVFHVFVGRRL